MRVLFMCFCMLTTCSLIGQTQSSEDQIVEEFIHDVINTTNYNKCVSDYLKIHNSYFRQGKIKPFFLDCIFSYIKEIKGEIKGNEGRYKILCHNKEVSNNIISDFKLKVNDYSGVYYLVLNDKVITNLIVRNHKIVSLCTSISDVQGHRKPWLFNKVSS